MEINTGDLVDVLYVPLQAVYAEAGKYYCYLDESTGLKKVEIEVGRSNDSFLEIVSGLDEGQLVLLYRPESAASTANAVQPSVRKSAGADGASTGRSGNGNPRSRRSGRPPQ